jgi:superfamily II DNA/RNA helicase
MADGIGVVAISGDTAVDDRPAAIARFRDDPDTRVMVSSRVGSEGLDFQFCSTMVNYDLPWNPMEVEQRIGRLDRIGQEADTIVIFNLWTKNTIEERILARLYDRIGIFERSIGGLETILGEVTAGLQRQLIRTELTDEEAAEVVEQAARVIEQRRQAVGDLEASAAAFVGVDTFFDEEVAAIKSKRRFVTGDQLRRFLTDFLRAEAPRTRLEYNDDTKLGSMTPDETLRQFLKRSGRGGDAVALVGSGGNAIPITFDSQTAFRRPSNSSVSPIR